MFRDQTHESLTDAIAWQHATLAQAQTQAPAAATLDISFAFTDRTGELSPVYREISRRIAGAAFTRHVSTLGDALR
jgi:hypothetical protein